MMSVYALLLLTLFASCTKPDSNSLTTKGKRTSALAREIGFFDWPSVNDGMLCFRDDDHYVAYEQYLDSVVSFSESNTDTALNDPNEMLESVESGLSFTSLRHNTEAAFNTLNETGWSTLAEIPEKQFINSISTKSILNANADYKIGDIITHYISKDYAVTIPDTATTMLNGLHGLSTTATFEDISNLDIIGEIMSIQELTINALGRGTTLKTAGTAGVVISTGITVYPPDPCNPKLIRIDNIRMANFTTPTKGNYHILWGDGNSTNVTSNGSTNSYWLNNVTHTYATNGNYTITIYGKIASTFPNYNPPYDGNHSVTIQMPMSCATGGSKTQG